MKIHGHFKQKNGDDPTMEWILARTGVVTASEMDALISPLGKPRTGEGVDTYLNQKLAEAWRGGPRDAFQSFTMGQGVILEEEALPFAEFNYGVKIQQVGFVSDDSGRIGCSPDGLMGWGEFLTDKPTDIMKMQGGETGIEIKSPILETQIGYLRAGELPKQYVAQVQSSMLITGCKTWHFLAYSRQAPPLHLVIERDEKFCANLQEALGGFMLRFDDALDQLIKLNGGLPNQRHRGIVPFPKTKWDLSASKTDHLSGA